MLSLFSNYNKARVISMFGEPENFSIYFNDEKLDGAIQASSAREAAEKYAAQYSIEGSWSMGSSKFIGVNGESIRAKTHY
jgi:hypothetical protein